MNWYHQARRQRGGQGGQCPPDFFLAPLRYFFGKKLDVFGRKKTLKFVISARKSLRISAKTFFVFGDHLLLVAKFVISARKSLRISAKTFAPMILILPPPISRSWRRPWVSQKSRKSQSCGIIPTFKTLKYWSLMALFSKFLINLITKPFVLNNGCNAIYCTGQYSICWPLDRTAKRRFQKRNSCKTRAYFLVVVSVMLSLVDVIKEAGILKIAL